MKQGKLHAWPSRKRILKEMNISVNTFGKYLKELKEANLIHVEQGRQTLKKGKQGFGNNCYVSI
jgi:predicted transcriptional regulator